MNENARPIAKLIEQLAREIYAEQRCGGLSPLQWAALRFWEGATLQNRTIHGTVRYLGISHAAAMQIATDINRYGLIDLAMGLDDPAVELNEQGRRLMLQDPLNRLVAVVEDMASWESAFLADLTEDLYDNLRRR